MRLLRGVGRLSCWGTRYQAGLCFVLTMESKTRTTGGGRGGVEEAATGLSTPSTMPSLLDMQLCVVGDASGNTSTTLVAGHPTCPIAVSSSPTTRTLPFRLLLNTCRSPRCMTSDNPFINLLLHSAPVRCRSGKVCRLRIRRLFTSGDLHRKQQRGVDQAACSGPVCLCGFLADAALT